MYQIIFYSYVIYKAYEELSYVIKSLCFVGKGIKSVYNVVFTIPSTKNITHHNDNYDDINWILIQN